VTDHLIEEQIRYYRSRAAEYDATAYGSLTSARARIERITSNLPRDTNTLELACGTGMWTEALAYRTGELTAIDASPEAIAIAKRRCPDSVSFVCADILQWVPNRRYGLIFFAFWLSHVPTSRIPTFFRLLERALAPSGEVVFVDEQESHASKEKRTADPEIVERALADGSVHRLVKVFVEPQKMVARLASLGWSCELSPDGPDWIVGRAQRQRSKAQPRG
jgi:demethylmenaquinone methyltransferase/2-methoxy-6-polyprenyl-1,4-benzoquinol methylase